MPGSQIAFKENYVTTEHTTYSKKKRKYIYVRILVAKRTTNTCEVPELR